jgi:sulfur transfer complex TusBCD TusB component (DsrH family)
MIYETLHLLNPHKSIELRSYLKLVKNSDAIVLFSSLSSQNEIDDLKKMLLEYTENVFVITNQKDYKKLVSLVVQYQRTFTWK